ncbi:MerR family transcriptional regulator [Caproiciproducens sp. LBM24188]
MKLKINETAKLTGISVRTLQYYDKIGLLHPDETTEAGYRLYGEPALERLQQILFFRELGFPLKEIGQILNDPSFDRNKALENHRNLLVLKRNRLDGLIALVDQTLKGESNMSFQEFDLSEIEAAKKQYGQEAMERWGNTEAYQESVHRTKQYGKKEWASISGEFDHIFRQFAAKRSLGPAHPEVQQLVADWQNFLTENFYHCTDEILSGLGQMYTADERFTKNIDGKYDDGTADFISQAIAVFVERKRS